MKATIVGIMFVCLLTIASSAQSYNNYKKEYLLVSQTDAVIESRRTHRMVLCDSQPSGLYVRKGEQLSIVVGALDPAYTLSSMIGFKPMWGDRNNTQEVRLKNGTNTVTASQAGILSFIFVKSAGYDTRPTTVKINVTGGKAFPLFHVGRSNLANWQNDLRIMTDAPFVQLISDKALVTIPFKDYLRSPIRDIAASFRTIHQVIDLEDELAGFDNSSLENTRTRNRLHYLVDLYSTPKEAEDYYMYATDHMIGMKRDNFTDLTEKLATEWGIWHETGHTHQQPDWLWGSITEISVNLFSLYVQEKFGQPSRLGTKEGGESLTTFNKARKYLSQQNRDYLAENEDDYNELFSKLVMFHQLKSAYGWDVFKKLHQSFRKQPRQDDDDLSDEEKANRFILAMCTITRNDLTPFFRKWGLSTNAATARIIRDLRLPLPATDPSTIFK